jgi:hypothetical protein
MSEVYLIKMRSEARLQNAQAEKQELENILLRAKVKAVTQGENE